MSDNISSIIKEKLVELADEKYREFHSKLCPNTNNILGVRVPVLRNYAKELIKEYSSEELLKNIDNQYYSFHSKLLILVHYQTWYNQLDHYIFLPH